jgi:hypothetical protein
MATKDRLEDVWRTTWELLRRDLLLLDRQTGRIVDSLSS